MEYKSPYGESSSQKKWEKLGVDWNDLKSAFDQIFILVNRAKDMPKDAKENKQVTVKDLERCFKEGGDLHFWVFDYALQVYNDEKFWANQSEVFLPTKEEIEMQEKFYSEGVKMMERNLKGDNSKKAQEQQKFMNEVAKTDPKDPVDEFTNLAIDNVEKYKKGKSLKEIRRTLGIALKQIKE
jgi:hypothetical protein